MWKCSLLHLDMWLSWKWMYYIKGVYTDEYYEDKYFEDYLFLHTKKEFSKTSALDLLFLFIFFLRLIYSSKFELIHLHKNMKSTLILSINVRLKVTRVCRVFCILKQYLIITQIKRYFLLVKWFDFYELRRKSQKLFTHL